jgi:hypothetical protein
VNHPSEDEKRKEILNNKQITTAAVEGTEEEG